MWAIGPAASQRVRMITGLRQRYQEVGSATVPQREGRKRAVKWVALFTLVRSLAALSHLYQAAARERLLKGRLPIGGKSPAGVRKEAATGWTCVPLPRASLCYKRALQPGRQVDQGRKSPFCGAAAAASETRTFLRLPRLCSCQFCRTLI